MPNIVSVDIVDEHTGETEPGAIVVEFEDEPDGQIIEYDGRDYKIEVYEGPYDVDDTGASYNAFGNPVDN